MGWLMGEELVEGEERRIGKNERTRLLVREVGMGFGKKME